MEIDFLPIFSPLFRGLCHFTALENNTSFYNHFFVFGGGESSTPAGAPTLIIITNCHNTLSDIHSVLQMSDGGVFPTIVVIRRRYGLKIMYFRPQENTNSDPVFPHYIRYLGSSLMKHVKKSQVQNSRCLVFCKPKIIFNCFSILTSNN